MPAFLRLALNDNARTLNVGFYVITRGFNSDADNQFAIAGNLMVMTN